VLEEFAKLDHVDPVIVDELFGVGRDVGWLIDLDCVQRRSFLFSKMGDPPPNKKFPFWEGFSHASRSQSHSPASLCYEKETLRTYVFLSFLFSGPIQTQTHRHSTSRKTGNDYMGLQTLVNTPIGKIHYTAL
jgi:hypothetical protein